MAEISIIIPSAVFIFKDESVEKKIRVNNCVVTAGNDSISINVIDNINNKLKMVVNIKFSEMTVYNDNKKDLILIIQLRPDFIY